MKILLVTGNRSSDRLREIAHRYGCEVYVAPVEVASFIKTEHLLHLHGYGLVIVPGYSRADLHAVEKSTGIRALKGPKDLSNLPLMLDNLDSVQFSKNLPACVLLKKELKERALADVRRFDAADFKTKLLKKQGNHSIGGVGVGKDFPMRVIAEIADADRMEHDCLIRTARGYIKDGADFVDLGFSDKNPEAIKDVLKTMKNLGVPFCIDTMEYENLIEAFEYGPDIILSLDRKLIEELPPTNSYAVIIPERDARTGVEERVESLQENIRLASEKGFKNLIADPILDPIGFGLADSITAYNSASRHIKNLLLMGVGNVTELTDADSIGINAVLAGVASECGVSLLFTTEASNKTKGCIEELKTASYMMFLSRMRQSPPKDLGLDLLRFKQKNRPDKVQPPLAGKTVKAVQRAHTPDVLGDFLISVDEKITVVHLKNGETDIAVDGVDAQTICDTLSHLGLISDYSHALYLGRELQKAEVALLTGRGYTQDEPIF